jgi:hypothetical protein
MSEMSLDLYRSCKSSDWRGKTADKRSAIFMYAYGEGSLYPDYKGFFRKDGTFRRPDIRTFTDKGGVVWVAGVDDSGPRGERYIGSEGVSLSTSPGGFGYRTWFYFLLPQGTPVPAPLEVRHTPSSRDAGHHLLCCRNAMRRDAFEGALDNLARSAIARAVELGRQCLYHS